MFGDGSNRGIATDKLIGLVGGLVRNRVLAIGGARFGWRAAASGAARA